MSAFAILWKSKLFRQVLAYAAIALVAWRGINWVHNAIIEEALEKNDVAWTVKLDDEKQKHADYLLSQEVLRAKLLADNAAKVKQNQEKYNATLSEVAAVRAQRDSISRSHVNLERLLNAASNFSDAGASQGRFVPGFARALQSCERDIDRALSIAGQEADRARAASAAAQALKVK
jgi:hypothetical protein